VDCSFQLANANKGVIDTLCDNMFPGEVQFNHLHTPFWVFPANDGPAQNLCLGLEGEDCTAVVVVKSGDSCSGIASAAAIPVSTLLMNNPNVNTTCSNIYPSEVRLNHTVHIQILIFLQVLCTASEIFKYN